MAWLSGIIPTARAMDDHHTIASITEWSDLSPVGKEAAIYMCAVRYMELSLGWTVPEEIMTRYFEVVNAWHDELDAKDPGQAEH